MRLFLEEDGRRLRAGWRLLALIVLFITFTAALSTLLTVLWFSVSGTGASLGGGAQAANSPAVFFIGSLASLISIFAATWVAGRFLDRRPFADFGFHVNRGWWLDFGFGLFLGAVLMSVIFVSELAFGWLSVTGSFETLLPGASFPAAILLPVGIFLCVGFYEEMLSRGYALRNIAEGLDYPAVGPRAAVLAAWAISSSIFGVLHAFNPNATFVSTFNIALAGLMLGAGYVLTGELAIPIGLHIAWNFFQGNVYGFPVSGLDTIGASFLSVKQSGPDLLTGGSFGPEAGLIGLAAMVLGGLLIALWVKLRYGRISIHTALAERPKQRSRVSEPSQTPV